MGSPCRMDSMNMWKLWRIILPAVFVLVSLADAKDTSNDNPVVETAHGQVRGKTEKIPRFIQRAYIFHNIPFAAPPIGKLRFLPPQPVEPWEGIRDATVKGPACMELANSLKEFMKEYVTNYLGISESEEKSASEDCLQLNVYTQGLNGTRPVMVYIHGGAFGAGWAGDYNMQAPVIAEDIVVVTIQYRLGTLGWLSIPDGSVPGNMGFLDQVAALQWVQENIAKFGGDPNQVTIYGHSAGSMSVNMHLLSPLSQGLFHRAILLSGASVDPNIYISTPEKTERALKTLAKQLDCSQEDSSRLLSCLQDVPVEKLFFNFLPYPLSIPRVDGKILPDTPAVLLESGKYNSGIDVIAGVSQVEGYLIAKALNPEFHAPNFDQENFREFARGILSAAYPVQTYKLNMLTKRVMSMYTQGPYQDNLEKGFVDFVGDIIITGATYKTASILAKRDNAKTFFYEFSRRSDHSLSPPYIISDHGQDIYFVHGYPASSHARENETFEQLTDRLTAIQTMKYFGNFARTGDPNGEGLTNWPQLNSSSYLVLEAYPYAQQNYQKDRMDLWCQTIPDILSGATRDTDEL